MAKGFLTAMRQYFGNPPSGEYEGQQGLRGFAAELKKLTPKDREELALMLSQELGEEIEVPRALS